MEHIVERLRQQQALLAEFGSFAFRETNLLLILNEAARVCATSLKVERAKICEYRQVQNDLLIVAGYGWNDGVIGQVVSQADESSPQGRAYMTGQPVICKDLTADDSFNLPAFYAEHRIVSIVDVIVKGLNGPPFGILEIDNTSQEDYDEHDINFLTGFANVLAEAVATATRNETLRYTMVQMQHLIAEKDQLLAEKDQLLADKNVLAEELQHRVRNNLQLVSGMLAEQLKHTSDRRGQRSIRGIQGRVAALAKIYDHLIGLGLSRTIDFSEYVQLLCQTLPELQVEGTDSIVLTCNVTSMTLDLKTVTSLGIAITELIANSYEHAFPSGTGRIIVTGKIMKRSQRGQVKISDDGIGYAETSPESKRRGIGLVYRLMEQVSGSVKVRVAQGTTWTLAFPVANSEQNSIV